MGYRLSLWILMLAGLGVVSAAPAKPPQPLATQSADAAHSQALLEQYCAGCHNEKLKTAGLSLDAAAASRPGETAAVWEKVVRKLRAGTMPPANIRHPSSEEYNFLINYLETGLDTAAAARPDPGRTVVHRLSRTEYGNAVRDLLAIDTTAVDVKSLLPADETAQGFDNMGTALSVSPVLMERYLAAAKKIARIAIGDPEETPIFATYTAPKFMIQSEDRISEDLTFGSRGGMAIHHHFPLEADYTIQILLQRTARTYIRGLLAGSHEIDVMLDGKTIQTFKVGGESKGPSTGDYSGPAVIPNAAQEEYERTADKDLNFRTHVTAGPHVIGVTFHKKDFLTEGPESVIQPRLGVIEYSQFKGGPPAVGSVVIGGPYSAQVDAKGIGDTPSRQRILQCRPARVAEEDACARKILTTLTHRAYRRPVTERDIAVSLSFYKTARTKGNFDAGIRAGLQRILLDPEFLFRIERDPAAIAPNTPYRISDIELASRLSFFLWSSIPDDELLAAAEQGRLKDPAVLERQVRRMLGDNRSAAMVTNFAGQWLLLRDLRSLNPDAEIFPYFDDNLREALQRETELFMDSQVRENHSITELLSANYTFLNNRLAEHYGIPGVYGSRFRRVTLTDENRMGLLGHGSILAITSYPNRTAPTLRGKWIMDNILGAAPPPPPPNVPDLKDNAVVGKVLTMRERMEQHRANPACASCHAQMDPLGFALENYDATGGWRTTEGGRAIDSSGVLPNGQQFEGPSGLRRVLLGKREQFVSAVTERLFTYALGRELEFYDAPSVRTMMREAARDDYRWTSIILGIVRSSPFQMKRSKAS